ncbi:hypothetical protein HAZT_HAZT008081 [Hyalella azteca]|uniref:Mos1 transposase HTH domain-containing protein n=1 Tax=Hyalella azteca TaxID=294128 RepID=A0A6A0GV48_HYAAZ|nr:hypothetical protein HAZT_HAZT008081 [Hyalella azteca]
MERGIVRDLKMLYRSSLVEFTMKAIQKSLLKPESTARHLPNESDNVSLGSEGNASFDKEILKVTNFKEFLEVDGKLCCCVDDEDDLVALIVQNIKEQCSTISNTHDRPGPCIASISNADTNEEDFTKEGEEVVISSLPPQMLEEYYVKEEDQDAADNISVKEEPMCLSGNQVLPGSGGERAQPSITDQLPTLSLPCPSVCKEENITTVVSEDQVSGALLHALMFGVAAQVLFSLIELQLPPRLEQRLAIKFCIGLGKSAEETLAMIRQVFGSESLPSSAVMRWHKFFRECAQLNSR